MDKRQVVKLAIEGRKIPYVPWHCGFTVEAADKLRKHFGREDLERVLDNHFVKLGADIGFFTDLGKDRMKKLLANPEQHKRLIDKANEDAWKIYVEQLARYRAN